MRHLIVLGAVVAALALAPAASPGGWATVGFEPLPDGMSAGSTWNPTIFVKQHGVTPLEGLQPVVEVYDDAGAVREFTATETSEPGVYEADVVFPSEGDWSLTIHSGFGDSHVTYGPVAIGAPDAGGPSSRELPIAGVGIAIMALLAGAALLVARRSRTADAGERLEAEREPAGGRRCRNDRWRTGRQATPRSPSARRTGTSARSRSSCVPTRASLFAPPTY